MVIMNPRHHPEVVGNAVCVSVTHPLAALPLVVVVEHKVHAALHASVDPLVDSVVVNLTEWYKRMMTARGKYESS